MLVKRNYFPINNIPKFVCPECGKGQLKKMPNAEIKKHPAWIKNLPDADTYEYLDEEQNIVEGFQISKNQVLGQENEEYMIAFFLECDVSHCQEVVVVSGTLVTKEEGDGDTYMNWVENVYPKSFTPTINIFEIPYGVPQNVKKELVKSFDLFWISPSASANSLRIAVEILLDEFEIDKEDSKGSFISLGNRIKDFASNSQTASIGAKLKEILTALKHIGNDGSHQSTLEYTDVLDGYKLFEKVLDSIYVKSDEKLNDIVEKINNAKKPISKIKP
jgi:hypothetical protein